MEVQNKKHTIWEFVAGSLTNILLFGLIFLIFSIQADPSCSGVDSTSCGMVELFILLVGVPILFITGLIELFLRNVSKNHKPFIYNKFYLKAVSALYLTPFYVYIIFKITGNFNKPNFVCSILLAIITIFLFNRAKKKTSNFASYEKETAEQTIAEPSIQNQKTNKLKYITGLIINLIILGINIAEIMDFMNQALTRKNLISIIILLIFSLILSVIIVKESLYIKDSFTSQSLKENKLLSNSHIIMLACLILSWFILVILSNITGL